MVAPFLAASGGAVAEQVRLEALVEVCGAPDGVDDGDDDEDEGDDGEAAEQAARRPVDFAPTLVRVHADEFEEEVGERAKVDDL